MSNILKIVLNEGAGGSTESFWWETSTAEFDVMSNYDFDFTYNTSLGYNVPLSWTMNDFLPLGWGEQWGVLDVNSDSWTPAVYTLPTNSDLPLSAAASCFWRFQGGGIKFHMDSINNNGLHSTGNDVAIELYPTSNDPSASYSWYYALAGFGGALAQHKIMPSIIWQTGTSYNASNEGITFPAETVERVHSDEFDYLPEVYGVMSTQSFLPFSYGITPDTQIDIFQYYRIISFCSKWAEVYNYKSYNAYNGFTTSSLETNSSNKIGALRLSWPDAASEVGINRGWNYINNDYLHKWRGMTLAGNTIDENFVSITAATWSQYMPSNGLHSDPQDYYEVLDNNNLFHFSDPANIYAANQWHPDVVTGGVYGSQYNKIYEPTIFGLDCFTDEAQDKCYVRVLLEMSFPTIPHATLDNSEQVLTESYINGTDDWTSTPTGEFTNGAISGEAWANGSTATPPAQLLGAGVWYNHHENGVQTGEFSPQSVTLVNGNLRLKKTGDNSAIPTMCCNVELYSSRTYRVFFKVSRATPMSQNNDNSFEVSIWDSSNTTVEEYLIAKRKINLDGSTQNVANSFNSNNYTNHNTLAINFNTPEIPRHIASVSNNNPTNSANKGNYKIRVMCTGKVSNFELHLEYIRFSSNVTGLTYENIDYVASRFLEPRGLCDNQISIVPSYINSYIPFTLTTALGKHKNIPDSSINYTAVENSNGYAIKVTAANNNQNSTWLKIQSTVSSTVNNLALTSAALNGIDNNGSLNVTLNGNTDCTATTVFPYEILDETNSFSDGVVTLPGNYSFAFLTFSMKIKNVSGWQGKVVKVTLIDQTGADVLSMWNVALSDTVTLPTNGNSTSVYISSNSFGSPTINSVPVDLTGITSLGVKIDSLEFPGGSSDELQFLTPNIGAILDIQPASQVQGISDVEWIPFNPQEVGIIGDYSNANSSSYGTAQTRKIKSTFLSQEADADSYHFSPLSKLKGDSQGFFDEQEVIHVNGRLKVAGSELNIFANTHKYKESGYSAVRAKIHAIRILSNENSYITREDEVLSVNGGSGINIYWNPTDANAVTLQPYITLDVSSFINVSGNVDIGIQGTTPEINIEISKWTNAGSTTASDLLIRSGNNVKVLTPSVGVHTFSLEMGSEIIEIAPTAINPTYTFWDNETPQSSKGCDIAINKITYQNGNDVVNIYTSPDNDGQGLRVLSNEPTTVPQSTAKHRYYVLSNTDAQIPGTANAATTPFVLIGTPADPIPTTGLTYEDGHQNTLDIFAWHLPTAIAYGFAYMDVAMTSDLGQWYLPSRDELTQAVAILGATGGLLDGYTYPSGTHHWTSSRGTVDSTKMFHVRIDQNPTVGLEDAVTDGNLVRLAMNFESFVDYSVGQSISGGTIWKKEALAAPVQTLKIIKTVDEIPDSSSPYINNNSFGWLLNAGLGIGGEENLAYFNALVSNSSSPNDGLTNTNNLSNLLPSTSGTDYIYEVATSSTQDGDSNWYIPSEFEWLKINANVGYGLDPTDPLYDAVNFTDTNLSNENDNVFYTSTLKPVTQYLYFLIFKARIPFQEIAQDGIVGLSPTSTNFRLRLTRTVEVANFTGSIGDSYGTDAIIYDIIPKGEGLVPPSIERWFNTIQLLSMAGLDTTWGELNEIKIEYSLDGMNPYNGTLLSHNLAQPTEEVHQTYQPSGELSYYQYPTEIDLITGTSFHTITQAEGVSNQDILNGKYIGFKLTFTNTDANQYLNINLRYIKLHLKQLTSNSSIEHDIRKEVVLDLYDQDNFSSTYCVKDFNNLDKGASDYTKTLKIPATASNKTAFASTSNMKGGYLKDVYEGVPANIYANGVNVFKGLAFLNKVTYSDNAKQQDLEVIFRGGNASWFSLLKELKLQDIPNMNRTREYSMSRAFAQNYEPQEILLPLIDKGKLKQHETNVTYLDVENLTPAYRISNIVDYIFKHINYSLSSNFMGSDGEFSGFEFTNEFNSMFKSFIAVTPPAKIPESQIEKSKIKLSFNNAGYKSKRAVQTNMGATWVGNHNVSDYYFHRTPLLKSWGNHQFNNVAVDYRPLKFTDTQYLNESGGSTVDLNSGLGSGQYIGVGVNSGIDGQFAPAPLSWGSVSDAPNVSSLVATAITVPRSGYYDVNSYSRVSFYRDSFLYNYWSIIDSIDPYAIDGGLIESNTYRAGIKKTSKFTILLVPYNAAENDVYINEKSFYESYFRRTDDSTFEYENDETHLNHHVSIKQRQYLKEGELYYPVAFNVEKINRDAYNQQMDEWFNEGDTSSYALSQVIDSLLVSGGDIKYIHRAFFIINECNIDISLSESPIERTWTAFYKGHAHPQISLADILPEITALEFISEISKMFNLIWTTNEITRSVKVEPYNSFYPMNKEDYLRDFIDWTDIAYIKEQKVNSVLPSILKYEFAKDSSDKTSTSDISSESFVNFGNISLNINPSNSIEKKVGLKVFSTARMAKAYDIFTNATNDVSNEVNVSEKRGIYLMRVYGEDKFTGYVSNTFKPDDLTTFNHKFSSTQGRLTMLELLAENGLPSNMLTGSAISYASYNAPFDSSEDYDMSMGLSGVLRVDTAYTYNDFNPNMPTLTFTNKAPSSVGSDLNLGLYNTYHKSQIEMLKFADKMVVAEVNLTPADINNLDFSKPIKINNDYYIINKIKDYKPTGESVTKVELLLIHPRGSKETL